MKNSFFYYLILFLIVASCKQPNEQNTVSKTESTEATTTNAVAMEVDDAPCTPPTKPITNCFSNRIILPEAAFLWQGGWIYLYNYDLDKREEREEYVYLKSPQTYFDKTVMTALYNDIDEADRGNAGVLISYISKKDATFYEPPGLAIQNIVDCKVNTLGPIYVAPYKGINGIKNGSPPQVGEPYNGKATLSNLDSLTDLKKHWTTQMTKAREKDYVFRLAESYIYPWSALKNETVDATNTGISINLGLRTLEPQEDCDFPSNPSSNSHGSAGSIVYVNVLYFGDTEWEDNGGFPYMDNFARPCPVYCDDN